MTEMKEFAPEYTEKERLLFIAKTLAWALPLFCVIQFIGLPWLLEFSDRAHCVTVFGLNGFELIFFGLFMGVPFILAIIYGLTLGRRALKVIQARQTPLPTEKVFLKTKIIYGDRAIVRGYVALCFLLALVIAACYGYVPAKGFLSNVDAKEFPKCSPKN